MGNKAPHNIEDLEYAEEQAKADGLGIWTKELQLIGQLSPKKIKQNEII